MAENAYKVIITGVGSAKPTITVRAIDSASQAFYSTSGPIEGKEVGKQVAAALNMARVHFLAHRAARQAEDEAMQRKYATE